MATAAKVSARVSFRPMRPEDIPQCVDLIASNPVLGARYGQLLEHLPKVWFDHLSREDNLSQVYFTDDGSNDVICIYGLSVAVHDEFLHSLKTPPHFWIGPELTRRIIAGKSPVLNHKEFLDANANGGMNLLVWDNCIRAGYETNSELHRAVMSSFIDIHRGYRWKEIIANQPESIERLTFLLDTGALFWDGGLGAYTAKLTVNSTEFVHQPYVLGTTPVAESTLQKAWGGRWVGVLFDYHAPKLGLNRSEQRLLTCAIAGATDERIAKMLGISIPTVKKMWISTYRRVEDKLPHLLHNFPRTETASSARGPEKRRSLLSYVREHPEELRPYSQTKAMNRTL